MIAELDGTIAEMEMQLETHIKTQLGTRVRHLGVVYRNKGIIMRGRAHTFHAKQLAQHLVMKMTSVPILANEFEVL
jgi:hypothetical protein